jgi:hypothetical protein
MSMCRRVTVVTLSIVALTILTISGVSGAGTDCSGTANMKPVYSDSPRLLNTTKNGKLFMTGGEIVKPNVYVVHLYGSPYEMGFAHGTLLAPVIRDSFNGLEQYIYSMVDKYIHSWPLALRELIERDGLWAALEYTLVMTQPFIPKHFMDEVQGMADAMGGNTTRDSLMRVMLFPELIQASCSMMGAWGDSVANSDGKYYQLRALDWGTDTPLQQWPAVYVYHPTQGGNDFTFVSWVGFIGAITGFSDKRMSICEKVWDHYKGPKPRDGMPWHFLLRDILQFDETKQAAISRIENANRTCSIFVGLSDNTGTFDVLEYSYAEVNVFNNSSPMPGIPVFNDVQYVDKHTQPSSHPCLPSLIKEYYGNINETVIYRHITAEFQTGNMHLAVLDWSEQVVYVANAAPVVNGTAVPAYDRSLVQLNLTALYNEAAP